MAIESRMHTAEGRITRLQLRADGHDTRLGDHATELKEHGRRLDEHARRIDAQDVRLLLLSGGGGLIGSAIGSLGVRGVLAWMGV